MTKRQGRFSRRRFLEGGGGVLAGAVMGGPVLTALAPRMAGATSAPARVSLAEVRQGNVFLAGHGMALAETVQDESGQGGSYRLDFAAQDAYGTGVTQRTDQVVLPAGGSWTRQVPVAGPRLGYYSASATLSAEGTEVASASTSMAVLAPPPSESQPASPWGIGGGGAWLGIRFDEAGANERFLLVHEAGIAFTREELYWDNLEPSPGSWDWAVFDPALIDARRHGVLCLGLLDYWASWSVPDGYGGAQTGVSWAEAVSNYASFCGEVVSRYRPGGTLAREQGWSDGYGIHQWEVWNEPPTFWSGTAQQFGMLVKAAAAAIRASDPDAVVVVSTGGPTFDQQVIDVAGIGAYDALAIHLYPGPVGPEQGAFVPQIQSTRQFLDRNGGHRVAIWITEMGWNVNGGVSPWDQASFIVRANIQCVAAGVERSLIFTLSYGGDGWGILTDPLEPRISYAAYATLTDQLRGLTPRREVPMGAALRAFAYEGTGPDGHRTVGSVWSIAESGTLAMDTGGLDIAVYDLMNNRAGAAQDGQLTVPLTGQPLFLVSHNASAQHLGQVIGQGTVSGISPLGLDISNLSDLPTSLPSLQVTVTNRVNVSQQGTVRITLPGGWAAASSSLGYGPLAPGESATLAYQLTQVVTSDANTYLVSVTASTNLAAGGVSASRTLYVTAVVRGTPAIDGDVTHFAGGAPVHVDQPAQVVGIPNWTPQDCSAVAWFMWDDQNFYCAVAVTDDIFFQPYHGSSIWNGDSTQLMFDPQNVKSGKPPSAQEYGLALTPQGEEVYRFSGSTYTGDVKEATLVCRRGSGGDVTYTLAIPLSVLTIPARAGYQFGMDFLVNDNDGTGRLGWIYWTPGIGNAWDSAQFSTWTLVESLGRMAARIEGGGQAVEVSFTLHATTATLQIDNRGLGEAQVQFNGGTILTLTTGTPGGGGYQISASGSTQIDVSAWVLPGTNSVRIIPPQAAGGSAVLSVVD